LKGLKFAMLLIAICYLAVVAAEPKANWPAAFFANFSEHGGAKTPTKPNTVGWFALDLTNDLGQVIYRADGSSSSCGHVHNDSTPCVELAVKESRYFYFPEKQDCCNCCSFKDGCGPIKPAWAENATYAGKKIVNGVSCDNFAIQGNEVNHMSQTSDGKTLCELDNAGFDIFDFDASTFTTKPDASLFKLPDMDCSKRCTPVGSFSEYGPCGLP
jgi:hypothetical protein